MAKARAKVPTSGTTGKRKQPRELRARAVRIRERGQDGPPMATVDVVDDEELLPKRAAPITDARELEEAALLVAIAEAPDDDGPREVYADLLVERGDSERAEVIQMQLARARSRTGVPSRKETKLVTAHAEEWLAPILPAVAKRSWTFVRGFLESVTILPRRRGVVRDAAGHPLWATVRRADISGGGDASPIVVHPVMRNLIAVDFARSPSSLLGVLQSDAAIRELQGLAMADIANNRALLSALVTCRGLPQLSAIVTSWRTDPIATSDATSVWTGGLDRPGLRVIVHDAGYRFAPWWTLVASAPPKHASVVISSASTQTRVVGRTIEVTTQDQVAGIRELAGALGVIPPIERQPPTGFVRLVLRVAPGWQALPVTLERPRYETLGQLVDAIAARIQPYGMSLGIEEGQWTADTLADPRMY